MSDAIVREAVVADAPGMTRAHVQSWRETYAGHFPAEFLARLDQVMRVDIWESNIANEASDVWIADLDGAIVGFAVALSDTEEDADGTAGTDPLPRRELAALYVLRDLHGTGIGQRLLDCVLGDAPAVLWVADRNPRAEAFYAKNGFARDGAAKTIPFADQTIDAVRMVRTSAPKEER